MFDQLLEESVAEAEEIVATFTRVAATPAPGAVLAAMLEAAQAMPDDAELAPLITGRMFWDKSIHWWT